ncbi:hypothetical protein Cgig2_003130 [Carnegiea gigantea]|uniref:Uncharacterized protein n=1 Tax=Carnegiea gigantea TaxID=171969 RepID=A0A9Q1GYI8_9CARY|nr:hypothetical protein Cgig2_003130 [Carnegiea gigantea]
MCKHCKASFKSSYTRIHYHFFEAPDGKKAGIQRCKELMRDRALHDRIRAKVLHAEKEELYSYGKKNIPTPSKPLHEALGLMERETVDLKVIRGLCSAGVPFNALRNPEFVDMLMAVNKAPKCYKPPSYEKARTSLLDECKRNLERDLIPIQETWYTQGVSIVSDGWSNTKHNPLINVLAVNSRGATFMYADDFSGIEKIGKTISDYLLKAIEDIGHQIKEIEKVHKHIFWSPCVCHTLNLIFKDFAKAFPWLRDRYKDRKNIVKYYINHSHILATLREHSKLELLKVAKTKFASHYTLLRRLLDCREQLVTTVCLSKWKDFVKNADASTGAKDDVEIIVRITKPLFLLIKFCDGDGPKIEKVYKRMDNMIGELKEIIKDNVHKDDYPIMEQIVLDRWEKMNIPIHCLGFALNPRFYDANFLKIPAPGGVERKPPNLDSEVMSGVLEAFRKIIESKEEEKLLREQYAVFHQRKRGLFAKLACQEDAVHMDPIDWWSTYGSETSELAEVAKKVLSQPVSSSSAKRNWSTYSYIHNVKRNRLNNARADKLVFIYSNICLLSRFSKSYTSGPYKYWDIDPESSTMEESITRMQELMWSIDNEEGSSSAKL